MVRYGKGARETHALRALPWQNPDVLRIALSGFEPRTERDALMGLTAASTSSCQ